MDVTKLNKDDMLSHVAEMLSDATERNEQLTNQIRFLFVILFISILLNMI